MTGHRRPSVVLGLLTLACAALLTACTAPAASSDGSPQVVKDGWTAHTSGSVAGSASCHLHRAKTGTRSDATCTPGAVTDEISPADTGKVCGMAQLPSNVSKDVASAVFDAYGVGSGQRGGYRLQFLIPRALGGANDYRNIWPVPVKDGSADAKASVDRTVTQAVCNQRAGIQAAQYALAHDWTAALTDLRLEPAGGTATP